MDGHAAPRYQALQQLWGDPAVALPKGDPIKEPVQLPRQPGCLSWLIRQPYLCLHHPTSLLILPLLYFWQQETPPELITPLWKVI